MALILSATDPVFGKHGYPKKIQLHFSQEGVVISNQQFGKQKYIPAARISILPSFKIPFSLPYSLFNFQFLPLIEKATLPKKDGQDALQLPSQTGYDLEDLFGRLSLDDKSSPRHIEAIVSNSDIVSVPKLETLDAHSQKPSPVLSGNAVPFRTAAGGRSGGDNTSGTSSRVSKPGSSRSRQSNGRGNLRSSKGGSSGGGGDDGPPELPAPIPFPENANNIVYHGCWFWLWDPVTYHSCAKVRQQAHHLKNKHLEKHFPNGKIDIPAELQQRSSWQDVWNYFFPDTPLPRFTDPNDQALLMAQQHRNMMRQLERQEAAFSPTPTTGARPTQLPQINTCTTGLSPAHSMAWTSDAQGSPLNTQGTQPMGFTPFQRPSLQLDTFSHGFLSPPFVAPVAPSITNTSSSWVTGVSLSGTSNEDSWVPLGAPDNKHLMLQPSADCARECEMRPDEFGLDDVIGMDIGSQALVSGYMDMDIQSSNCNSMSMMQSEEIDTILNTPVPFSPTDPRLMIVDWMSGDSYFWDDRHPQEAFEFDKYFLVHFGERPTGADVGIAMRSLDALQNEYYGNLKSRAGGEGYIKLAKSPNSVALSAILCR